MRLGLFWAFWGFGEGVKVGMNKVEIVSFGGCSARIRRRGNGFFAITWREAKRGRSTTAATLERARALARAKVRELAGKAGSRLVSLTEAEAIEGLKAVAGGRSLSGVVEQIRDAAARVGGLSHVLRACELYVAAGHGKLTACSVAEAVGRFVASHAKSASLYRRGLQKELRAFVAAGNGDVPMVEVTAEVLRPWISRLNADGSEPGWRYFNNRLATWKTFLNRCREWNVLLRGERHAGEIIKPMRAVDSVPEIWSVAEGRAILAAVREGLAESLTYVVVGCWMGLRPFEMQRVRPGMFDWERGYLNVGAEVAMKTMQQRFVPIPGNVRELLYERLTVAERFWGSGKGRKRARSIVRSDDQVFVSRLLRERGIIESWPQDVMRHSYISYRLAQGHGRGQVAEWAGNSEGEIRRSYRRPLRREDGEGWFEVGIEK